VVITGRSGNKFRYCRGQRAGPALKSTACLNISRKPRWSTVPGSNTSS